MTKNVRAKIGTLTVLALLAVALPSQRAWAPPKLDAGEIEEGVDAAKGAAGAAGRDGGEVGNAVGKAIKNVDPRAGFDPNIEAPPRQMYGAAPPPDGPPKPPRLKREPLDANAEKPKPAPVKSTAAGDAPKPVDAQPKSVYQPAPRRPAQPTPADPDANTNYGELQLKARPEDRPLPATPTAEPPPATPARYGDLPNAAPKPYDSVHDPISDKPLKYGNLAGEGPPQKPPKPAKLPRQAPTKDVPRNHAGLGEDGRLQPPGEQLPAKPMNYGRLGGEAEPKPLNYGKLGANEKLVAVGAAKKMSTATKVVIGGVVTTVVLGGLGVGAYYSIQHFDPTLLPPALQ